MNTPNGQQPASSAAQTCSAVLAEVERATAKFPTWPTDPLHALAVLGEEFGELTKEMVQLVYEPHKTDRATVRKEAVQTAAMALRLVMSLDRYEYRQQPQHDQNAPHKVPCAACDRGDFQIGHAHDCRKSSSEGDQYIGMTLEQLEQRNAEMSSGKEKL